MNSSPPWQVLDLVARLLDPKALATAACVCKSWAVSMSSDHLWHHLFTSHYPSLCSLHATAAFSSSSSVSYHKLYSLGRAAEHRRLRAPPKPHLSLQQLIFSVDIRNSRECFLTAVKPGRDVQPDKGGVFRFDLDMAEEKTVEFEALDSMRITCNVVLDGFRGVFTMMDCEGKGSFVLGVEGCFSKELPSPGCCSDGDASGLVVDLRLILRDSGGKAAVEKMSIGVLSILHWRYVRVEEALRYLQHFLLP